jgi:hypothetical protein
MRGGTCDRQEGLFRCEFVFDDVVVDVPAKALMAKPVAMEKIRAL